ncbi:MAG: glycosyltransferase [Gammaproteobacteria bacterium]
MYVPTASIAVVVKSFPRLSNTFITQELRALERSGLRLRLYALGGTGHAKPSAAEREIRAPVTVLSRLIATSPATLLAPVTAPAVARRALFADLRRNPSPRRLAYFTLARALAVALPDDAARLYAHFLDGAGSVARYAALMTGRPWCAFAHADIWAMPVWEVREKLADADWIATCTKAGHDRLSGLGGDPEKVFLSYHGIALGVIPDPLPARPPRNGGDKDNPVHLLSVGRAVEKKGYDVLLEALARLPGNLSWRFEHIGGGPRLSALKAKTNALDLGGRVSWLGPKSHDKVLEHCRRADVFVLASHIAAKGRRDGLPNVLVEAQSQGLACVATNISAIPELIRDGETGLLVAPESPDTLADALVWMMRNPAARLRMGANGAERVRRHFDMDVGIRRLLARLAAPAADARRAAGRR